MKLLVHGASAQGHPRLALAARGLAERGHVMTWSGPEAPRRGDVDVVVGAGPGFGVAWLGWRHHARAQVVATDAAALKRQGLVGRLAWDSLPAMALIDESSADAIRAMLPPEALARFALWSSVPPPAVADVTHPDVDVLERACERALARSRSMSPRAAIFVDRDGTLVVERGYLADPDGIELLPGVATALRMAKSAGYPVVVISNQAGVGRGRFPLQRVYATMARLRQLLAREGVELDAIHFCPHAPDAGCACRKPGTLLLERAAQDLLLSTRRSVMIGDKRLDAATGQAAGGLGVLVATGYGGAEPADPGAPIGTRDPDATVDNLLEAVRWFLARGEAHAEG